jgi:hypothetical protein
MRCIHCPTPENVRCAGLDVRRFCELIDPSCAQYEPGYLKVIVRMSARTEDDSAAMLTLHHPLAFGTSPIGGAERIAITADCCGGGVLPGASHDQ